jgi:hypothetical protein
MIDIDKLMDRLHAAATDAAELMAAGKMSAAAEVMITTGNLGRLVGTHPDAESMSLASQEKLAQVEALGDALTMKFREHGIVN